jgi:hypothetical protein
MHFHCRDLSEDSRKLMVTMLRLALNCSINVAVAAWLLNWLLFDT